MKVQIIYLDPHDDHVSARDKLGWVQAPRVLIVWPRHGRVLTRRLDLTLLQRLANQRSVQLGLVTLDPDVLDNAEALSIPSFESLDHVSERGWRRRARGRPKRFRLEQRLSTAAKPTRPETTYSPQAQRLRGYLRPVIVGVAVLSLLVLAVTLIPSAEVIVSPKLQRIETQFSLQLNPELQKPLSDGSIPAYVITKQVTDSLRLPTSGKVSVPSTAAQGFVTFTNLTSERVTVPAGTGLRASTEGDLRFVTTESVVVPAGTGTQAQVSIESDFLGPDGNLPSGTIDAIEGTLGLQLAVQNEKATKGGANELRASVGFADLRLLEEELTTIILHEVAESISAGKDSDEKLFPETLRVVEIFSRSFDREIGDPADTLSLTLDLEISGYAYRIDDVETSAQITLKATAPDALITTPDSFGFEITGTEISDRGEMIVRGNTWQDFYQPLNEAQIRNLLRAQAPEYGKTFLEQSLDLEEDPVFRLFPFWLPRLPWLPQRISIRYAWKNNG